MVGNEDEMPNQGIVLAPTTVCTGPLDAKGHRLLPLSRCYLAVHRLA